MNKLLALIAVTMSVVFFGCPLRSLAPLFAEKDLIFNPSLLGSWKTVQEAELVTFSKSGDKEYSALLTGKEGDTARYVIQLGKLGKFWFMDSYPFHKNDDYQVLPTHLIWRIWIEGDTIRIASLEGDWLKREIDSKKLHIECTRSDGDILLTSSTEDLQKLAQHYAEDENAFPKPDTYVRVK